LESGKDWSGFAVECHQTRMAGNFFSTAAGRTIILKGWKKPGISGLLDGTTVLPPNNHFADIYNTNSGNED
jgi:hypothetical protein